MITKALVPAPAAARRSIGLWSYDALTLLRSAFGASRRLSALEDRGVGAISYDRLIRDDDRRARRDDVVNLVRKLRIDR